MWFVTSRRFNAEIAALRGYNDALRERCEVAEANERTERVARQTITRQHAELDADNRRLAGRNKELQDKAQARGAVAQQRGTALGRLGTRLANVEGEYSHIDGYAARMEERLDRALKAAARYLSAYHAEKRRADHLQQRYDDAVGLPAGRITDSSSWQPGYEKPKGDSA